MNILVAESDRATREAIVNAIRNVPMKVDISIAEVSVLEEIEGLLVTPGITYDIVICAETIKLSDDTADVGNGRELMETHQKLIPHIIMVGKVTASGNDRFWNIDPYPNNHGHTGADVARLICRVLTKVA